VTARFAAIVGLYDGKVKHCCAIWRIC